MGMVTAPRYRRKGIAKRIFGDLIQLAKGRGHNIALMATDMGRKVYEKQGFVPLGERPKYQHSDLPQLMSQLEGSSPGIESGDTKVLAATTTDLATIAQLDWQAFGEDRSRMLKSVLGGTVDGSAKGCGVVLYRGGERMVAGYALVSCVPATGTLAIGPLVAASAEDMVMMVHVLLSQATGDMKPGEPGMGYCTTSMLLNGQTVPEAHYRSLEALGFERVAVMTAMGYIDDEDGGSHSSGAIATNCFRPSYVCCAGPSWG